MKLQDQRCSALSRNLTSISAKKRERERKFGRRQVLFEYIKSRLKINR